MHKTSLSFDVKTCCSLLNSIIVTTVMCCFVGSGIVVAADAPIEKTVDFQREIKPLLARHCYACHGPGDEKGGLAFVSREKALAELDSGDRAIVPSDIKHSMILDRLRTTDESIQMPPEGARMKPEDIAKIERWIQEGADWKVHWAFQPVIRPAIPTVTDQAQLNNPIDAFVTAKLESAGLSPMPQAAKRDLIRRLYFDLIGLPPTMEQMQTALATPWPEGYEQLVDELLNSPQYGEKWARHWLDVVRFAETNSFERDNPKPYAWRYRDYVIQAFNNDKPFDQFVSQQIAGDEDEKFPAEGTVATGFYRLGVWDDEPADRELAMYDGYDDLVTTVGQGVLGLTVNCARCHDHKIDPISQKDYYSLVSFFRGIKPMQTKGDNIEQPIFASLAEQTKYDKALTKLKQEKDHVQSQLSDLETRFSKAYENQMKVETDKIDLEHLAYKFYRDDWEKLPIFDQLKAETEESLSTHLIDIGLSTRETHFGFVFTGELIVPEDGEYTFKLDSDDGSRLMLNHEMIMEYDGIHGTGKPVVKSIVLTAGRVPFRLEYFQRQHGKGLHLSWSGPQFTQRFLTTLPGIDPKSKPVIKDLIPQIGKQILGEEDTNKYQALRKEQEKLNKKTLTTDVALCVKEVGKDVPETHVLLRGNPQVHGDVVEPGFLEILGGGKANIDTNAVTKTSGRRRELAKWLTSRDNYLTARVIVNRVWQNHFGRGIVRSPNNFGQLGDPPTHPELLEWLSCELMDHDWSLKYLHKLILMSATYQRSSHASDQGLAKDPGNLLFWRFNLRRLSAEEVRDSVLDVSGQFNPEMYGESIYPTLSKDVLETQSDPGRGWGKSSASEQARRSIYIHVKRSLIVPQLAVFDFPETDITCDARFTTTLPSQALTMINSDFMHDTAKQFALYLESLASTDVDQLREAYALVYQREPNPTEQQEHLQFLQLLQSKYQLSTRESLAMFCLVLLNSNEFMYVD
jgi:hypothetical protein